MRTVFAFSVVFALLLTGCGSTETPSSQTMAEEEEVEYDASEEAGEAVAELEESEVQDPEITIDYYLRDRKGFIEDLPDGADVQINGSVYFNNGDLAILNFTEQWGPKELEYAIVLNAKQQSNQLMSDDAGDFGNLAFFLSEYFQSQTAFYKGNFADAPDYQIVDYKPFLLVNEYNQATYFESTAELFLLTHQLERMPVMTTTMGYGGECDKFNGFKERFVLGQTPYNIIVEREENGYNEKCDLQYSFAYKKVWMEANLLNQSEGGPTADVPTYFITDLTTKEGFTDFPKSFTGLVVEGEDTLYNDKKLSITIMQNGSVQTPFMDESDYFAEEQALMIGFEKHSDSSFTIFSRQIGLNHDHYVSDRDAWLDTEQNHEFRKLQITLIDSRKGVYLFEDENSGRASLFTTKETLFEQAEIETNL